MIAPPNVNRKIDCGCVVNDDTKFIVKNKVVEGQTLLGAGSLLQRTCQCSGALTGESRVGNVTYSKLNVWTMRPSGYQAATYAADVK